MCLSNTCSEEFKHESITWGDKDVDKDTQSSHQERASQTQPSASFVQGEKDKKFCWDLRETEDELCQVNVRTKSHNI